MKSVLISIQPKWCELIANGKKILEVRKTRPNIKTPFKCYIYCTKKFYRKGDGYFQGKYCGKVIGEFVCDKIIDIKPFGIDNIREFENQTCLTSDEIVDYLNGFYGYAWHISDLVIYDKPKELSEFRSYNCSVYLENGYPLPTHEIKRPPQSWYYVTEQ